jgi:ribonuclease Z
MKKALLSVSIIIMFLIAATWVITEFFPHKVVPIMLNWQIEKLMGNAEVFNDKESITVYTVGTASPLPGKRAQTGTAVIVNGHFFMFDVGDGVVQKAETMRLPLDKLDGVFITHWHSDHFMDLPYIISRSWVLGRTNDLHIYGPTGLDTLNQAINQLLHVENQYRVDHHGAALMNIEKAVGIPHEFNVEENDKQVVYNQDGITITAFDVNHEPIEPAVGYVIEYNSKKVVISGDTKRNELVLEMAQDADLLIHEVILISLLKQASTNLNESGLSRNSKILTDIQDYHTSPSEVAELAAKANVKKLVLHHFAPAPDFKIVENLYRREMTAYKGQIEFANDGDTFVVK